MSAETPNVADTASNYLFRGDSNYSRGSVDRQFGGEADAADIQNLAEHVLRKESNKTSRFVSFSREVKIAQRFISAVDNRCFAKVSWSALRELEARGIIKGWEADQVESQLREGPKKLARQASDVRTAMKRNREVLIEGQIPAGTMERVN